MKKPRDYRERNYSNSGLKPKQLTVKREHELRTYPYHNGGGINHRTPFGRKDKLWSETQRDQLFQHIDWLQQEVTKELQALLDKVPTAAECRVALANNIDYRDSQIIAAAARLGINIKPA